jgi:hypothetical protein
MSFHLETVSASIIRELFVAQSDTVGIQGPVSLSESKPIEEQWAESGIYY